MRVPGSRSLTLVALLLSTLSVGCASSARISQFETFAVAGDQYAQAMDGLLTESTTQLIDTNSRKLLIPAQKVRQQEDPELREQGLQALDLKTALKESDVAIQEHLDAIALVRSQVQLLGSYFRQLAALATTDAPEQFGGQLNGTVTAINGLSENLKGSPVLGPKLVEAAQGIGQLIVQGVQSRQLEEELRDRKETITALIRTHQRLLELIENQVEQDRRILTLEEYRDQVRTPLLELSYERDAWMAARRSALMPTELQGHIAATQGALGNLETAWKKLLANELTLSDVQAVVQDLQPVLSAFSE